jgi:hypothetical protein
MSLLGTYSECPLMAKDIYSLYCASVPPVQPAKEYGSASWLNRLLLIYAVL